MAVKIISRHAHDRHMNHSLNSFKGGIFRGLSRGLLQGLLRLAKEVWCESIFAFGVAPLVKKAVSLIVSPLPRENASMATGAKTSMSLVIVYAPFVGQTHTVKKTVFGMEVANTLHAVTRLNGFGGNLFSRGFRPLTPQHGGGQRPLQERPLPSAPDAPQAFDLDLDLFAWEPSPVEEPTEPVRSLDYGSYARNYTLNVV